MKPPLLPQWSAIRVPVIGMLHLLPLPGAPRYDGKLAAVRERLLADADALAEGGVDGLLLENFGDSPFYPDRVPAETIAHMASLAATVRQRFDLPLGINCLRNDALAALAIAHAADADFIRVNVLTAARVADQGVLQGQAHLLLRERARLGAAKIRILADLDVKHSAPLGQTRPIEDEVRELIDRALADGVIVSGTATGRSTDLDMLRRVSRAAGKTPVFVGSGVGSANVLHYLDTADGLIVGSAFQSEQRAGQPVEARRVLAVMAAVRRWRGLAE